MESGDEPVPSDVRGWLNTQMADTFRGGARGEVALGRTVQDLEARLPQLIEEAVTSRFQQMAGKLHQEIEDTHVRTLETFVKNIQVKLVQRVAALETDMSKQAEAMMQLREYSARTEDNLGRLISGVDRLAKELPQRLALPEPQSQASSSSSSDSRGTRRRSSSRGFSLSPKVFWAVVAALIVVVFGVIQLVKSSRGGKSPRPSATASSPASAEPDTAPAKTEVTANSDIKTKLQAAQEYTDRKDYTTAEDIYKQVLKTEPNNVEALKALASVLYREDKIEESAAILEKLPKN
jgi:cytochrome c-type biogenesis protein CcmH/NrfG